MDRARERSWRLSEREKEHKQYVGQVFVKPWHPEEHEGQVLRSWRLQGKLWHLQSARLA
jgi:hypothetical protein